MTFKNKLLASALLASSVFTSTTFASSIADIFAGYDGNWDNSFFTVTNNSGFDLTSVTFSSGADTWVWGTVAVSTSATLGFGGSGAFQYDYDDYYAGGGDNVYSISAVWNGQNLSASFSPNTNESGIFIGFLGNNSAGGESDSSVNGLVASLQAVPEPEQWAMLLSGLSLMTLLGRKKSV